MPELKPGLKLQEGEATSTGLTVDPHYAAFVVQPGRAVERIEFRDAESLEVLMRRWRGEILAADDEAAGRQLADRLWKPIQERLTADVEQIYICPEASLAQIPWSALPDGDRVLLERYAFACVPHGQTLVARLSEQLAEQPSERRVDEASQGSVLVVGDVDYGDSEGSSPPQLASLARSGLELPSWSALPGAAKEAGDVLAAAGARRRTLLSGADATTQRVVGELQQHRYIHLATHGFAVGAGEEAERGSSLLATAATFRRAARNPLTACGLVLAGANLSTSAAKEGTLLLAEEVAALPLNDVRLVTLSACQTALGDVEVGEGVFGLQRAFHLAGADNVVGSVWQVDDRATAALMRVFYEKLWRDKLPPAQALRAAQLSLYRDPVAATLDRGTTKRRITLAEGAAPSNAKPKRAPTRLWAAFLLSGSGR